ncbi:hypothetical protein [Streptomyces olivochromogenes]|uniref:hypothetical protein n=1 Tax=Streptomyces olivochromogenes TaxID=1963 RepID=UPI001F3C9D05|nr:hypothetical protein [Streptomyces olivochromogenes]MCF3137301.1 hypothetical protein [Streptomyces olivochromogenes]
MHLLECRGCRKQRTLPSRYRIEVVRAYLETTEHHGGCQRRPLAQNTALAHGIHQFELECWWHETTWPRGFTVPETAAPVRNFVDQAIGAVRSLRLELHPVDGTEIITPTVIQIRGDKANFRP